MLRVRGCYVNDVNGGVGDHVDIRIVTVRAGAIEVLGNQIGEGIGTRPTLTRWHRCVLPGRVRSRQEPCGRYVQYTCDSPTDSGRGVRGITLGAAVSDTTVSPTVQPVWVFHPLSKGICIA
jgi:hypothetical protein